MADKCWKGYVAKGKKKSPSGKRTKGGAIKMVNNCVKNQELEKPNDNKHFRAKKKKT